MTSRHGDGEGAGERRHGWTWWANAVWITCAAVIAMGTILRFLGVVSFSAAMAPVRHEIGAATDTTRRLIYQERRERMAAIESLRTAMQTNHDDVMRELGHIETLVIRTRTP